MLQSLATYSTQSVYSVPNYTYSSDTMSVMEGAVSG